MFMAGALAVVSAIYVGGNVSGEAAGGRAPDGGAHPCEWGCMPVAP